MKCKFMVAGLALCSLTAMAQQLHDGDIRWPNSQRLYQYVSGWIPGQPVKVTSATNTNPKSNGVDFEDENFFISRVRLKPLFRNQATQVDGNLTEENDKKLLNWVPVNRADGVHTDAMPNGVFDSEVFSNWSYVTHWGDWIAPHGWVPSALADAAHKHGVLVSGVASVPYGSISSAWKTPINGLAEFENTENEEKLAQFLYFHGVDGLGYNSEFSGMTAASLTKLQNVHKYVMNWMDEKGMRFENIWYDGTNDNGYIQFDNGLTSSNDGNFSGSSLFLNYNWQNVLQRSVTYAKNMDKNPLDLYAGHNMQGGEPGYNNWTRLAQYPVSIGLWGAHDYNMLWAQRSANGSAPATMQETYQLRNEQWFTNAKRNPVSRMEIYDRAKFSPDDKWFGMSVYMSARSSLCWDLNEEPFITYFNLGNGTFLNWEGERQNNNEWYNLGVQDYMPTWRWWFTNKFLGKEINDVPESGLDARFTWKDAWLGGSCLNISGSTPEEYLHLFKTKFEIKSGDVITLRYKLLGGKADAKLIFSLEGDEATPIEYELFDSSREIDSEWVKYSFTVDGSEDIANSTIAMIALGFENAEDLNLYIGELSIVRNSTPAPEQPEIKVARILRNNYHGVDAKIIFNMKNDKEKNGEPCYNLDVNTSLFKLYAEIDGEVKLMGLTSSWAGMYFSIPVGEAKSIRLGVSAVSTDMQSESPIAWTEELNVGDREISNEIVVSQNVIKPGEAFTVGYLDMDHAPAQWEISDAYTGEVVKQEEGAIQVSFDKGLDKVGPYNVKVVESNGNVRTFNWMVQITEESAGAMPKIYELTIDGETEPVKIEPGQTLDVAYTGREADGSTTRAISAEEVWVGAKLGDTGLKLGESFTVASWLNYTSLDKDGSSCLLSIEDRTTSWPQNNWGWFWSNLNGDGSIGSFTLRTSYDGGSAEIKYSFADAKIPLDLWTHVAIVFDYKSSNEIRAKLYINGILQESTWECASGSKVNSTQRGTTEDFVTYPNGVFRPSASMWISFFGGRGSNSIPGNGLVDDLQIWDKALTDEEVVASMSQTRENIPDNLLCYWDFESNAELDDESNSFTSLGSNKDAKASNFALVAAESEGQAVQTPQSPMFAAGNPFLKGNGYTITTTPSWTGRRATILESNGNGAEGYAKVTYTKDGDYTLTLTLSNDYGSDTRDYPVITVGNASGIEDVTSNGDLRTYTVDDSLYIVFAEDGKYEVSVYSLRGELVARKAQNAISGETMKITLGGSGVYVARVIKDGKEAKSFKVMRR